MTMNVSLTRELEDYVKEQVKTGHYKSASEVIREALRGKIHAEMEQRLDLRLVASMQQVADGQTIPADREFFDHARQWVKTNYIDKKPSA